MMNNKNMNLYLLSYFYRVLNIQIERQNALKVQEYLYSALSQASNQLFFQSLLQNSYKGQEIASFPSDNKINNFIKAETQLDKIQNHNQNQNQSENKEKVNIELYTKITKNKCNISNISEVTPENTDIDWKEGKNFGCNYEGCNKKFEYKWILDRHANSHFCLKMFKCGYDICEKAYKSKENLNLHIKNKHLGLKPYGCKFCTARFSHRNGKKYFFISVLQN